MSDGIELVEQLQWEISTQTERPSNYDRRVTLNADDVLALIARAETAEAVITEALKIEPAESKPSRMQGYELDQAFGYNEARDDFRDILSAAVLQPQPGDGVIA